MSQPFGTLQTPTAITVTTSPTLLCEASNRLAVIFQNTGSVDVTIGGSASLAAGVGLLVAAGKSSTDVLTKGRWYGITASSTSVIQVQPVA